MDGENFMENPMKKWMIWRVFPYFWFNTQLFLFKKKSPNPSKSNRSTLNLGTENTKASKEEVSANNPINYLNCLFGGKKQKHLESLVGGWTNPSEKYACQTGWFPQIGVKIKNIWNHHLESPRFAICNRKIKNNKNFHTPLASQMQTSDCLAQSCHRIVAGSTAVSGSVSTAAVAIESAAAKGGALRWGKVFEATGWLKNNWWMDVFLLRNLWKNDVSTGLTPYNIYAVCENWVYTKKTAFQCGKFWCLCGWLVLTHVIDCENQTPQGQTHVFQNKA